MGKRLARRLLGNEHIPVTDLGGGGGVIVYNLFFQFQFGGLVQINRRGFTLCRTTCHSIIIGCWPELLGYT